jgi:hypothetical protein
MTGPISPPNDPGSPTPDPLPTPDPNNPDTGPYAPSVFMSDYQFPPQGTVVVPPMPRSEGGLIQAVKTAVVEALRETLHGTQLFDREQDIYIDLEYPMKEIHYPGIWVQFSISKLNRAGVGHEVTFQDPETNVWTFIQEWMFVGRITLTICALKSIERDRIADALITNLAFARPPELLLTMPQADTKQYRSLITALDKNPYVAMTLMNDTLIPGGQQASMGTPWKDDILTYEDNYSLDLTGSFMLQFSHDGMYTLARIDPNPRVYEGVVGPVYDPSLWLGTPPPSPPGAPNWPSGVNNVGNTDIPVF